MRGRVNSLTVRMALAGILTALIAVALVAAGVLLVGRATFEALMAQHGNAAAASYEMFDYSVTRVLIGASVAGLACAIILAVLTAIVMPESPRWLISKGRAREAQRSIRKLYRVGDQSFALPVLPASSANCLRRGSLSIKAFNSGDGGVPLVVIAS